MTWLAVAASYALLWAVYALGHELGYRKGREERREAVRTMGRLVHDRLRREVPDEPGAA